MAPLPRPMDRHIQIWLSSGGGGRRLAPAPVGDAGWCSPVRSSSAAGRPDLCATSGTSTSGSMDTVDYPQCSLLRSSSIAGRPDLRATSGASTTGIVGTVDELLELATTGPLLPHHDDSSSHGL
jgi:hypothetical protein